MSVVARAQFEGRVVGGDLGERAPTPRLDHLHALWHRLSAQGEDIDAVAQWEDDHHALRKAYALDPGPDLLRLRDGEVRFTVSTLGEAGAEAAGRAAQRWQRGTHQLGPVKVRGTAVRWLTPPVVFGDLLAARLTDSDRVVWRLETPTAVRQGNGIESPFPQPQAVFRGLDARAVAYLGLPPLADADGPASTFPRVSRFRLETRLVDLGRRKFIGSVGEIFYDLRHLDAPQRRRYQALALVAEFSGVGHATTHGMGVVRRLAVDGLALRGTP